jgi:hypothetical protein
MIYVSGPYHPSNYLNGFLRGPQHFQDTPQLTTQLPALSKARAAA